jgi:hypothetical protein
MQNTKVLGLFMEQISLATKDGIKGKDDCLDTISMLPLMNAWTPNPEEPKEQAQISTEDLIWENESEDEYETELDAYIV